MGITEIDGNPGMQLHPLYDIIPCEAYVNSPIIVNDSVWGTLNYTSFETREEPFSLHDIEYNEIQATKIAEVIKRTNL